MIVLIETESLLDLHRHLTNVIGSEDNPCEDAVRKRLHGLLVDAYHDLNSVNDEDDETLKYLNLFTNDLWVIYNILKPTILRVNEDVSIALRIGENKCSPP